MNGMSGRLQQINWGLLIALFLGLGLLMGCSQEGSPSVVTASSDKTTVKQKVLPAEIQQHLKSTLGMNEADLQSLRHELMPEGFIWAIVDPKITLCLAYIKQDNQWNNVYMGMGIPEGWRPTNTGTGFMGNEAELHSLTVWAKENCQPPE